MLIVQQVALNAVTLAAPLFDRIDRRDKSLGIQLRRAAESLYLNIAEATGNDPGNARSRFFSAAGSNKETRAALQLATAFRYITPAEVAPIDTELDRIAAMLYRLTRGR